MGMRITDVPVHSGLNTPVVGAMLASVAAGTMIWLVLYMIYRWVAG